MQKRPKAQSNLAQGPLIYVIPVQTGIQLIDFDRLLWTPIDFNDFYRLFFFGHAVHIDP